ncbi:MAG: cyclodeaminase/cyclohydrolase family protein [Candidatus Omnitrophica bacterium]|nr:cyclodeaminase/cyclohydrolase family protein [Candidatus Omnitrophota bacterium]
MKTYYKGLKPFLDDLAGRKPSPGGGSAAAFLFCLGLSLIDKSLNFSIVSKAVLPAQKAKNHKLKNTISVFADLKRTFLPFVDKDGQVFDKIINSQGERRKALVRKSEKMIADMADSCRQAISLAKKAESDIKNNIISDFNIGCYCLFVCLMACLENLQANKAIFGTQNSNIAKIKKYLRNVGNI